MELKELKAGDMVFVYNRWDRNLRKVEKITPSGLIKVDGRLFYDYGSKRGNNDNWNGDRIEVATEEKIEKFRKEAFITNCKKRINTFIGTNKMSYEQAVKIIEILGEEVE